MKQSIYLLALMTTMALGFTACSDDILATGSDNQAIEEGAGNVTVTLQLPTAMEITRGNNLWKYDPERTSSAMGGLTNCELGTTYALRYQLEVWDEAGVNRIIDRQVTIDSYEDVVSYQLNLYPGHTYRIVAWADFIDKKPNGDYHTDKPWLDDKFYNTYDLRNVTAKHDGKTISYPDKDGNMIEETQDFNDSYWLNLEGRDAYWKATTITLDNSTYLLNMVLRRPFAKLRVVTTDWESKGLPVPERVEIQYSGGKRFDSMNLLTGETTSRNIDENRIYRTDVNAKNRYKLSYDGESDNNRTLWVDYLMTADDNTEDNIGQSDEPEDVQTTFHFEMRAYKKIGDGTPIVQGMEVEGDEYVLTSRKFDTDIPIRRNYLTTILGDVLTTAVNIRVLCFEAFMRENIVHYANTEWADVKTQKPSLHAADETDDNPYWIINTIEEWKWLQSDEYADNGQYYDIALNRDLNFNGISNYTPLHFDHADAILYGRGHTISNINITTVDYIAPGYPCMAVICSNGQGSAQTIKNLNFTNITIQAPQDLDEAPATYYVEAAPLCGLNNAQIENVSARHINIFAPMPTEEEETENYSWVIGGLASKIVTTTMTNCHVSDITLYGYRYCGGLLGFTSDPTISNCTSTDVTIRTTKRVVGGNIMSTVVDAQGAEHLRLETGALSGFIACRTNENPLGTGNIVTGCTIYHPTGMRNEPVEDETGNITDDFEFYQPDNPLWGLALSKWNHQ